MICIEEEPQLSAVGADFACNARSCNTQTAESLGVRIVLPTTGYLPEKTAKCRKSSVSDLRTTHPRGIPIWRRRPGYHPKRLRRRARRTSLTGEDQRELRVIYTGELAVLSRCSMASRAFGARMQEAARQDAMTPHLRTCRTVAPTLRILRARAAA